MAGMTRQVAFYESTGETNLEGMHRTQDNLFRMSHFIVLALYAIIPRISWGA